MPVRPIDHWRDGEDGAFGVKAGGVGSGARGGGHGVRLFSSGCPGGGRGQPGRGCGPCPAGRRAGRRGSGFAPICATTAGFATRPALATSSTTPRRRLRRGVLCKIAVIAYRVPTRSASAFAKETVLTSTFDRVADIIAETSEIDRDSITPESHTIDDLGIDSLDFLDIVFAIDKEFGIKIPLEKWTQRVNEGEANTEEYFVMKNLCAKIDELRAAKGA
jgi:acyl carrier protein